MYSNTYLFMCKYIHGYKYCWKGLLGIPLVVLIDFFKFCFRNGHMMTHSSKKPYECKFLNCDKSYCDQRSLRRHIENHHQQYLDCSTPTSASEAALLSGRLPGNSGESVFQFDPTYLTHFSGGVDSGSGGLLNSPVGISPTSASQKGTWPFGYNPLE